MDLQKQSFPFHEVKSTPFHEVKSNRELLPGGRNFQTRFSLFEVSEELVEQAPHVDLTPLTQEVPENSVYELSENDESTKEKIKTVYPPGIKSKKTSSRISALIQPKYTFTRIGTYQNRTDSDLQAELTLLGFDVAFYRRKWKEIHTKGAAAQTGKLSSKKFCRWMRSVPDTLPCTICSNHAKEYIGRNPPESAMQPFIWTWKFHNEVNKRKGKAKMPYSTASRAYGVPH